MTDGRQPDGCNGLTNSPAPRPIVAGSRPTSAQIASSVASRGASSSTWALDARRRRGGRAGHRDAVPRALVRAVLRAPEQLVRDPERIEADLLGGACHPAEVGPAGRRSLRPELHDRQDNPDFERAQGDPSSDNPKRRV
ncbi:MAG TPA: hypothetical protein VFO73_11270 [Candidatus Limnocylindrales bacterium]|jgi:hypothetical protein|nr:hypothetical protein [Candidatus Limnocylindrales bacterium]